MKTIDELACWIEGAAQEFEDPSEPIGHMFLRWIEPIGSYRGNELACGTMDGKTYLRLGPGAMLPIEIEEGEHATIDSEGVPRYVAKPIQAGLWAVSPSLFIAGMVHAFVTLYDVPLQAPWRSRVIPVRKWPPPAMRFDIVR